MSEAIKTTPWHLVSFNRNADDWDIIDAFTSEEAARLRGEHLFGEGKSCVVQLHWHEVGQMLLRTRFGFVAGLLKSVAAGIPRCGHPTP